MKTVQVHLIIWTTLADGSKMFGVAEKRGGTKVILTDTNNVETEFKCVLLFKTYPKIILSVKAATTSSAQATFAETTAR